jgi:hypothetical protein
MGIVHDMSAQCRSQVNCQGKLGPVLKQTLQRVVPAGAAARCRRKAYLSLSTGDSYVVPPSRNVLVGEFSSDADLVEAAHASSFIPVWSGGPATTYHGQRAFDGVFSNGQPCPPGVAYCLKISSRNPLWSARLKPLYAALSHATSAGHFKPAQLANAPAGGFARVASVGGGGDSSSSSKALAKAAELGVDIAPGLFHDTGLSTLEWDRLLVMPGDDATNQHLYELGSADARAWAHATGLAAAAAARRQQQQQQAGPCQRT